MDIGASLHQAKGTVEAMKNNPETALSIAYDMVLNGTEIGGGFTAYQYLRYAKSGIWSIGYFWKPKPKKILILT